MGVLGRTRKFKTLAGEGAGSLPTLAAPTMMIIRPSNPGSVRAVCTSDVNGALTVFDGHSNGPGIAADLAVLNKAAADVGLDEEFNLLTAVGTDNKDAFVHDHESIGGTSQMAG